MCVCKGGLAGELSSVLGVLAGELTEGTVKMEARRFSHTQPLGISSHCRPSVSPLPSLFTFYNVFRYLFYLHMTILPICLYVHQKVLCPLKWMAMCHHVSAGDQNAGSLKEEHVS